MLPSWMCTPALHPCGECMLRMQSTLLSIPSASKHSSSRPTRQRRCTLPRCRLGYIDGCVCIRVVSHKALATNGGDEADLTEATLKRLMAKIAQLEELKVRTRRAAGSAVPCQICDLRMTCCGVMPCGQQASASYEGQSVLKP